MPGIPGSGLKAQETMIKRMGLSKYKQFISERGRMGGRVSHPETRPFANTILAQEAGQKGGLKSRPKKKWWQ